MKKSKTIKNIEDIVQWRLCIGCGACVYICPKNKIKLDNIFDQGIRPKMIDYECGDCNDCLKVCPGYEIIHDWLNYKKLPLNNSLKKSWGPVIDVWEGFPADNEIRFNGSSAGAATALALYCIEKMGMSGVVHIGEDPETPWLNKTFFSQNRHDLLEKTGSRYAPASPCEALGKIENASSPCVFIGKPCDLTALRKAAKINPKLAENIGCTIGIFCAGTPSTRATLDLISKSNIPLETISKIRYRGKGWPGNFSVWQKNIKNPGFSIPYMEAWGFLQKYRPFRCYLCPDATSEFADISCGDPWYRKIKSDKEGFSLICTRNEIGDSIVKKAILDNYIFLEKRDGHLLVESQSGMPHKRGAIWGRTTAMNLFNIPTPKLKGFSIFRNWLNLSFWDKFRSFFGTVRRIINRKYTKPLENS